MTSLLLGPLLRHVTEDTATVWVETGAPCSVEVLGRREPTFTVGGRHYAVVALTGLAPGAEHPYEVALDGVVRWPEAGSGRPPSLIRLPAAGAARARIAVGSCRVSAPETPSAAASPDDDPPGRGPDALRALARRVAGGPPGERPDLLLLIGDQVYVDLGATGGGTADFDGLARLYGRAWGDPLVRWLLSTVPSAMILDDHEVRDGWNTSARRRRAREDDPAWRGHLAACLAAYWVYQHLGNLAPGELARDPLLAAVRAAGDGIEALVPAVARAGAGRPAFHFTRRLGPARLVVADARGRRVLDPGRRAMLDGDGWAWLDAHLRADAPHLLLVSSVPAFLPRGLHELEGWSEAVAGGAWGRRAAPLAERVRRAYSLEHWSAFGDSFARLARMLGEAARGERGAAPASVIVVAGEVHHGSVTRVRPPGAPAGGPPVWQLVSSPLRNLLDRRHRALLRLASTRPFAWTAQGAARAAGVPRPDGRWDPASPLLFANHVALLDLDGRRARLRVDAAVDGGGGTAVLETVLERRLS